MIDLTVRDHARDATHPPVVVVPNASLRHVAHHLWEHAVAAAVVADADDVLGVISERDVVTQLAQGSDPDQ